jgi:hypothetical protein
MNLIKALGLGILLMVYEYFRWNRQCDGGCRKFSAYDGNFCNKLTAVAVSGHYLLPGFRFF